MNEKGNVLVIGNSGVGKSTLINAVLGEEKARTGGGESGNTKKIMLYENDNLPFRLIDTIGFEPSLVKEREAVNAVKKWSKDSAKEGHEDNIINVIWFCVEGTSRKLFPKAIQSLSRATAMWENVPVIVVITKSYSVPDRAENIDMVNMVFARKKKYSERLRNIIPVVASTFVLNDTAYAPPEGITELIDATNELMPEGIKAAEQDLSAFKLKRKRALAQGLVGASTAIAATVGAVPVPFADGLILAPLEGAEINTLARIYGIDKEEGSKQFLNTIIEVGTVGAAAKAAISAIKAIPGINLAASVINAIIAGSIVAALGEGSIFAFEKVYNGEKTVKDIDWLQKVIESKFTSQFLEKVTGIVEDVSKNEDNKDEGKLIAELVSAMFVDSDKKTSKKRNKKSADESDE